MPLPGRWFGILLYDRHADLRDRLIEERDKEGLLTLHRNYHNDELKKANTCLWQQAVERKLQLYVVTIVCCLAILLGGESTSFYIKGNNRKYCVRKDRLPISRSC